MLPQMLPKTMRAIAITRPGGPQMLQQVEMPCPQPQGRQILIRLHAAGVNRPDIAQRQGVYPPPPDASPLPGLEGAGEVVACGEQALRFTVGTRVMALLPGGGYAEYALVDERHALILPQWMDFVMAAAIPETFLTVWHNLFELGRLTKGEVALVHGGASGIGTVAIQLARAFGAHVIATAGSEKKCQACRDLGANLAIHYHEADFVAAVHDETQGRGVDVILDMVGGDYVTRNYQAACVGGRIIQIAFLQGHKAQINLNLLMQKRLYHTGSTLRGRDDDFKARLVAAMAQHVMPLLETGEVRPIIDTILPLTQAAKAHELLEAGQHIGKIVLKII